MRFFPSSLGHKIILFTFLLTAVTFVAVLLVTHRWQKQNIFYELTSACEFNVTLVKLAFEEPMRLGHDNETKKQFKALSRYKNIKIFLIDLNGTVSYSTEDETIGRNVFALYPSLSLRNMVDDSLNGRLSANRIAELQSGRVFVGIEIIPNDSSCYHCHGASRQNIGAIVMVEDVSEQFARLHGFSRFSAFIIGGGLLVLLSGLLIFIRNVMLNRITKIERKSKAVISGDLDVQFDVGGNDELTRLADHLTDLVARRKEAEAKLHELAITDGLTGLFNRRYFREMASHEFMRSRRSGKPLSMMLIDIDFFKQVNDTHGHAAGDQVLRVFAEICHAALREIDILGRIGGEEFCALLPDTGLSAAVAVAERLRVRVAETTVFFTGKTVAFTVSIGVAALAPDIKEMDTLIKCADEALYAAKEKGRNRVEAHA